MKTDFQQFQDSTKKMETVIARINDQSPINHEIKKVKVSLTVSLTQVLSKGTTVKNECGRSKNEQPSFQPSVFISWSYQFIIKHL